VSLAHEQLSKQGARASHSEHEDAHRFATLSYSPRSSSGPSIPARRSPETAARRGIDCSGVTASVDWCLISPILAG
jgi:hypothetical protein